MKKLLALVFLTSCAVQNVWSQGGEIPVDMYTGTPSIEIPLWTVVDHDISHEVKLTYNANAAKAGEFNGRFGMGWDMYAGGMITRELRGLPDDFGFNDSRKGWFYETPSADFSVAGVIGSFANTADLSASTCTDETADFNAIKGFNYVVDTEPDVFSYNIPGYSGKFVFDNALNIRMIPYQDIRIKYTTPSVNNKTITAFTITTHDGYVYSFARTLAASKEAVKFGFLGAVSFLSTEYELYKTKVDYTSGWALTRIDSPTGAYITFSHNLDSDVSERPVNVGIYVVKSEITLGSTDLRTRQLYTVKETSTLPYISAINTSVQNIEFRYNTEDGQTSLETVKINDLRRGAGAAAFVKQYDFEYLIVPYDFEGVTAYSRPFLTKISEYNECDIMPPYRFSYNNVRDGVRLPAPVNSIDAWGYYNGAGNDQLIPKLYIYPSETGQDRYRLDPIPGYTGQAVVLNGANRSASSSMTMGVLYSIVYPAGGTTFFTFEPHQYFDSRTNQSYMGGGMRIADVSYFDGLSSNTRINKHFTYLDAAGNSSGRLISRPVFAMPAYKWKDPDHFSSSSTAYDKTYTSLSGDDIWKFLTVRTENSIDDEQRTNGSTVGYTTVTVARTGGGSAKYEYYAPGVFGETSNGDWQATQNKFARPASCANMGVVSTGGAWAFPHAPNPQFDYEQGLLWKKSEFDEQGKLIRYTLNTYQYLYKSGTQPAKVWGLRYEKYALCDDITTTNTIFFYGKYFLLTDVMKVTNQETVNLYDAADATGTKVLSESTQYTYGSAKHKLLTQVTRTAVDGTVYKSQTKYPLDYTVVSGSAEPAVTMLDSLQDDFRNGIPIEVVNTMRRPGGTERVVGGSLTKFADFGTGKPWVESQWNLNAKYPVAIDSFKSSSVVLQNGVYKLDIDSRYESPVSYLNYDVNGNVRSVRSRNKVLTSTLVGYGNSLPVAQATNASLGQFAFSDFETTTGYEFQVSGTPSYSTGYTGTKAIYPAALLSAQVDKAAVSNYRLRFRINSASAINFAIALRNTAGTTTFYTTTVAAPATGGIFQYVEQNIPISTVTDSRFTVTLQAQGLPATPTGAFPVIDDVAFYPENAVFTSTTYDIPFGTNSVTNGRGVASFSVYDKLGRIRQMLDEEKNIVKNVGYAFYANPLELRADFILPLQAYVNESATFKAVRNDCITGITYEWDFGGGYSVGTQEQAHTFTAEGSYNILLRMTHAVYGSKVVKKRITVTYKPIPVQICAKGVAVYSAADNLIQSTYSCSDISGTPPAYGIIFQAYPINIGQAVALQWKVRDVGTTAWTSVGSGPQYTFTKVVPLTNSFEVRCDAIGDEGGTGSSNVITVTVIK